MKVGITGHEGVIGTRLSMAGCYNLICDITNPEQVKDIISEAKPTVVIHCAALTDVAYCESHFKDAFEVNVRGTSNVVEAMSKDALFVYLSSDHLFNGNNWLAQGYGEWQKPSPVNNYGFTKWGGEIVAKTGKCRSIIVRSSKLFYYWGLKDIIDKLKNGEIIEFTDIIKRSFYHANHFVENLLWLVHNIEKFPDLDVVNISGRDVFSYFLFWDNLRKYIGLPGKITPRLHALKEATPRPFRGGLETSYAKKLGIPLYSLQDGFELIEQGL